MTRRPALLLFALFLSAMLLAALQGCNRIDDLFGRTPRASYGDVAFKGPPAKTIPRKAIASRPMCHAADLQAAQNDPACVGTVLRASPTGPTITVLERGLALLPAPMESELLAPPQE